MGPGGVITMLALVALGPVAPPPPAPEPFPVRIDFDAPAGCSGVGAFYAGVLGRIDRAQLIRAAAAGVHFGVRLTRTRSQVHGELQMIDQHGSTETRKVDGSNCQEVVEVLSLTAAIAIDPSARLSARPVAAAAPATNSSPPSPGANSSAASPTPASGAGASPASLPPASDASGPLSPAGANPAARAQSEVRAAPSATTARPGHRLGFALEAETAAAEVVSPYISVGGAVVARFSLDSAAPEAGDATGGGPSPSLGVALLYLPNDLVQSPTEVAARLTAAELTVCPGWGLRRVVTIQPCLLGIGGWLTAADHAVTNPQSAARSWWSVGAMVRAVMPLGAGFAVHLEAGASVPLADRRFMTTTPERTVAETPPVSALIGLGIGHGL